MQSLPLLLNSCLLLGVGPAAPAAPLTDGSPDNQAKTDDVVDIRSWTDAPDRPYTGTKVDEKAAAALGLRPKDIEMPRKTRNVVPLYPESARVARQQGVVILDCRIDPDGTTKDCKVMKALSAALNDAALTSVQQWRYRPLRIHGQVRAALIRIVVNFRL